MYELGQLSKVLTQQLLGYAPLHPTYLDVILGMVFIMHQEVESLPSSLFCSGGMLHTSTTSRLIQQQPQLIWKKRGQAVQIRGLSFR